MAVKKKALTTKEGSAMSSNFFVSVALAALLILVIIFLVVKDQIDDYSRQTLNYLISNESVETSSPSQDPLIVSSDKEKKEIGEEKAFGLAEASVKIYYFSDYDCSFCQKQDSILQKLLRKYPQDLRVVVKDYPDQGEDSKTFRLALGGFCAWQQGKYWEYKALVWRNFEKYQDVSDLLWYVSRQLSLETAEFNVCLQKKETIEVVKNDLRDAIDSGAFLVPFIKLNDREFLGEASESELEKAILAELSK